MATAPTFQRAHRRQAKARVAILGPSGSGKTYTALLFAAVLSDGEPFAVIDTEEGSASLYSDEFTFDVLELGPPYSPARYIEAIHAAEQAGYPAVVADSLTHEWSGPGGVLDMVDKAKARSSAKDSFTVWKDITPQHDALVHTLISSPIHVIATTRVKQGYEMAKDDKGRNVVNKLGLQPIQRDGLEYEFTVVCDMDLEHTIVVSKSRCKPLADAVVNNRGSADPTRVMAETLKTWLVSGEAIAAAHPAPARTPEPEPVSEPLPLGNGDSPPPVRRASDKQIGFLTKLIAKHGTTIAAVCAHLEIGDFSDLTAKMASDTIDELNAAKPGGVSWATKDDPEPDAPTPSQNDVAAEKPAAGAITPTHIKGLLFTVRKIAELTGDVLTDEAAYAEIGKAVGVEGLDAWGLDHWTAAQAEAAGKELNRNLSDLRKAQETEGKP